MKIIIVSPHFPPSALPPSQRVRLLTKNLKNNGVETVIITTEPKYREEKEDPWMVDLAGSDFKLIKIKSLSQKLTRKVGVGDLGLRMIPFLFPKLIKTIKREKPDYVFYPVPPWYILLIAPLVKKITGVNYVIDFIDPWVEGGELNPNVPFKRKISQKLARKMEYFVCKEAFAIYSVSEGINQDLVARHPALKKVPMYAIPYGAEESDFQNNQMPVEKSENTLIRYIGAVWDDAYPVLEVILEAFSKVKKDIKVEFYGTSYAGEGLSEPQLQKWLNKYGINDKVKEYPNRVPYKKAVELTLNSDFLLLFGGMQAYYAASKLFGLIVSKKPFLAFLHKDSFPGKFLKKMNYPYLVLYSSEGKEMPSYKLSELTFTLEKLINDFSNFVPLNLNDPDILKYTADGMTKAFINPLKKLK